MVDVTNEFAIDPRTNEAIAIDPPLQENDAPLMGNPILARRAVPRRGRSNIALYGGVAAAVVILAGGVALFAAQANHGSDLMTNAPSTSPVPEQAAMTPAPAPVAPPAPAAPILADASTPEAPVLPARAERSQVRATRHAEHRAAAQSAAENGADTAATVTQSQVAPPPAVAATPAPSETMTAPAAPPVVTPPPPAQ